MPSFPSETPKPKRLVLPTANAAKRRYTRSRTPCPRAAFARATPRYPRRSRTRRRSNRISCRSCSRPLLRRRRRRRRRAPGRTSPLESTRTRAANREARRRLRWSRGNTRLEIRDFRDLWCLDTRSLRRDLPPRGPAPRLDAPPRRRPAARARRRRPPGRPFPMPDPRGVDELLDERRGDVSVHVHALDRATALPRVLERPPEAMDAAAESSDASRRTYAASFPPSSRTVFGAPAMASRTAPRATFAPVSADPVNAMAPRPRSATSDAPTLGPPWHV